jgi:hypothetical protein
MRLFEAEPPWAILKRGDERAVNEISPVCVKTIALDFRRRSEER